MSLTNPGNAPEPRHKSPLQSVMPLTTVAIIIAAIYAGWTVYSRHAEAQRGAEQAQAKQEDQRRSVDQQVLQHGELMFTSLAAEPGQVKRGETSRLCYGVVNATKMTLDPPVEPVKPSERHCFEVTPKQTTTYKFTALDDRGQSKSLSLTVTVK